MPFTAYPWKLSTATAAVFYWPQGQLWFSVERPYPGNEFQEVESFEPSWRPATAEGFLQ